jgi:hypothetical protein
MGRGRRCGAVPTTMRYRPAGGRSLPRGTGLRSLVKGGKQANLIDAGAVGSRVPSTQLAIDQGSTDGNCSACGARVGLRSSAKASGVPLAPSRIGAFRGQGQRQGARSLRRAWNVVASSRRQRNTGNYVVLGVRQNRESIARTARE